MDVASIDEELPEDFFSDEELASAPEIAPTEPDDSEMLKDPQVAFQTRSSSTHAAPPAAEAPEPAGVPPTTKVDQSPSTEQQSSTSHPTTPPTDSPSQTDVPPEPVSQSQAMKRPLEQTLLPESKRMSLGEEHGILAVEDLRWWPRQRPRGVRCPLKCWSPDTAGGRGQVLTPCAQDEVVEVAFALSHHEAVKITETPATVLAALARQGREEVRVSTLTPRERGDLIKAEQAAQTCSGGGSYEIWIAMHQLNTDALGHHEETR